jgi:hypothetical protein
MHQTESLWRKNRTILVPAHGLESQKISGRGRSVLLDFSFYRTSRDLAMLGGEIASALFAQLNLVICCEEGNLFLRIVGVVEDRYPHSDVKGLPARPDL